MPTQSKPKSTIAGKTKRKHSKPPGKPFVKGDPRICRSGAAKSKGAKVAKQWREWLESADPASVEGQLRIDALRDLLWDYAMSGNKLGLKAIEILLDRAYGKPAQTITGDADAPLLTTFKDWVAFHNAKDGTGH